MPRKEGDIKQCTRCKDYHPATEWFFSYRKNSFDKLQYLCRRCSQIMKKKYKLDKKINAMIQSSSIVGEGFPTIIKRRKQMEKPKGFEDCLSDYGPMLYDAYSGEPIQWGFEILKRIGDERFNELSNHGKLECNHAFPTATWYLITRELTFKEAVEKYGKVTDMDIGPRGGFHSVEFGGKTRFNSDVAKGWYKRGELV